jgi:hypothetical protein
MVQWLLCVGNLFSTFIYVGFYSGILKYKIQKIVFALFMGIHRSSFDYIPFLILDVPLVFINSIFIKVSWVMFFNLFLFYANLFLLLLLNLMNLYEVLLLESLYFDFLRRLYYYMVVFFLLFNDFHFPYLNSLFLLID